MTATADQNTIRCVVTLRNPFTLLHLPWLSRLHRAAFRPRRRLSKRFIGKPAKRLFRLLLALGAGGDGRVRVDTAGGPRLVGFNARNTQFGALYQPQSQPLYEPETSALLDRLVADDDVFYDIGANWGWYAVLIASRPSFRGRVEAFEPFPATFADLDRMVRQAGLDGCIHCHDLALADRDGEAGMAFSDGVQSGLARLGEAGGTTVRLGRLDSLPLPPPNVVKIDAEDHELEVLIGATAVIESARPVIVFENWLHRDRPGLTLDPITFLAARSYCFFLPGWVCGDPNCILATPGQSPELALVPFRPEQRFQLPSQLNIVAVPVEKLAAFAARFGA